MKNQFPIQERQALLYLLAEAAELEHGLCCSYLFAAFSLKRDTSEGLTPEEVSATLRWRGILSSIAGEEMRHLASANNILTALGAGPHFSRPNLPVPAKYYPPEIQVSLRPFSAETLDHFIYLERPEAVSLRDAPVYERQAEQQERQEQQPVHTAAVAASTPPDYETVNRLYRDIGDALVHLVERYGEAKVFVGPLRAETAYFELQGLAPVTDLASAQAAIDQIVDEGEGGSGSKADSHYGNFIHIRDEYAALKRQRPRFTPGRPVLENPFTHQAADGARVNLMDDPFTVQVNNLFNAAYETLVQVLGRFFLHGEETEAEVQTLMDTAIAIMTGVLTPLGETLTTLPAGPSYPGLTAGPSFAFYRAGDTLPHKHAAWLLLHERLAELVAYCGQLECHIGAPRALVSVRTALCELEKVLARHLG